MPGPSLCPLPPTPTPCLAHAWGLRCLGGGVKSGVRECGGNLPGQGLGLAPCLLAILLKSQTRHPPPQGVKSEVLVMTGMAAQGAPRRACLPDGTDAVCACACERQSPHRARVMFSITPAACPPQAVCGIFAGDPRGTEPCLASREGHRSSSMKPGLEAPS